MAQKKIRGDRLGRPPVYLKNHPDALVIDKWPWPKQSTLYWHKYDPLVGDFFRWAKKNGYKRASDALRECVMRAVEDDGKK